MRKPTVNKKASTQLQEAVEAALYPNGVFDPQVAQSLLTPFGKDRLYCYTSMHDNIGHRLPLEDCPKDILTRNITLLAGDSGYGKEFFQHLHAGLDSLGIATPFAPSYRAFHDDNLSPLGTQTPFAPSYRAFHDDNLSPLGTQTPLPFKIVHHTPSRPVTKLEKPVARDTHDVKTVPPTVAGASTDGKYSTLIAKSNAVITMSPDDDSSTRRAKERLLRADNWAAGVSAEARSGRTLG